MYYTAIKHSDHLRTLDKCRKHSPEARVFYISLVFSNDHRVLSQCNARLLYLLNGVKNTSCNEHDGRDFKQKVSREWSQLECAASVFSFG